MMNLLNSIEFYHYINKKHNQRTSTLPSMHWLRVQTLLSQSEEEYEIENCCVFTRLKSWLLLQ